MHHRRALLIVAVALVADAVCGWLYGVHEHIGVARGLYNALANAVTLGGDAAPVNGWGYAVNTVECLTVIPLFAATLSLFTSGLTSTHVRASERRVKAHLEARLLHHLGGGDVRQEDT